MAEARVVYAVLCGEQSQLAHFLTDQASTYQYTCRLIEGSQVLPRVGMESHEVANGSFFIDRTITYLAIPNLHVYDIRISTYTVSLITE